MVPTDIQFGDAISEFGQKRPGGQSLTRSAIASTTDIKSVVKYVHRMLSNATHPAPRKQHEQRQFGAIMQRTLI
jgi:hypothetical protein